jgi:DNA-directed RNA polymerase subunit RPC12/RpoP
MCAEYGVGNIGDDEVTYYVRCPRCGNRSHGVTVQPRFTYHSGQSAAANEWNSLAEETTHV